MLFANRPFGLIEDAVSKNEKARGIDFYAPSDIQRPTSAIQQQQQQQQLSLLYNQR